MLYKIDNNLDFEQNVKNNPKPVLVDFWAPWCGPCRNIAPALDELSQEQSNFDIAKVNVDENEDLAIEYRIQSIPAFMVFYNGKVVANRVGAGSKQDLLDFVNSVI